MQNEPRPRLQQIAPSENAEVDSEQKVVAEMDHRLSWLRTLQIDEEHAKSSALRRLSFTLFCCDLQPEPKIFATALHELLSPGAPVTLDRVFSCNAVDVERRLAQFKVDQLRWRLPFWHYVFFER